MKRTLYCALVLAALAASSGCHMMGRTPTDIAVSDDPYMSDAGCQDGNCSPGAGAAELLPGAEVACQDACDSGCCGTACRGVLPAMAAHCRDRCAGRHGGVAEGPSMGAVVYPYYTVRGPRDFFLDDPPSIGR